MKLPIPEDWDGVSWQCIEVQWPDSVQYRGLLLGVLSLLTRGRLWDESTGTIRDAQAVGWQIFNRNYPLTECTVCDSDNGDNGSVDNSSPYALGQIATGNPAALDEDEEMGQVVTDVQIIGGKIRVFFGPCCYRDLEGIDLAVDTGEEIEDPYVPSDGSTDPNTYSACAKAWAIVDAIEAVLNAAYDVVGGSLLPWTWPGKVETAVDMNLNDKWTVALIIDWMALGILITAENAFTQSDQEKSAQALVNVLGDDTAGIPDEATYEAVKNAIHTRGLVYDGLIMSAIAALGRSNLDRIAKMGAIADPSRTCEEPVDFGLQIPVPHDWALLIDFRTGLHGFSDPQAKWVDGVGFSFPNMVKYNSFPPTSRNVEAGVANCGVRYMAMHVASWPLFTGTGAGASPKHFQLNGTSYFDAGDWQLRLEWMDSTMVKSIGAGNPVDISYQLQITDDITVGTDDLIWDMAVIAGIGPKPWSDIDDFPE
jgi:hypothetical protein